MTTAYAANLRFVPSGNCVLEEQDGVVALSAAYPHLLQHNDGVHASAVLSTDCEG